jgi:hypothetical protein
MRAPLIMLALLAATPVLADESATQMCMDIAQQRISALLDSSVASDRNRATGIMLGESLSGGRARKCADNPRYALTIPAPHQRVSIQCHNDGFGNTQCYSED